MIFPTQLKLSLKRLFPSTPREVASPFRQPVYDRNKLLGFIRSHHLYSPVFSAIYAFSRSYGPTAITNVDKLFFDIDAKGDPRAARETTITLMERLDGYGIPMTNMTTVFTGGKGWHVYVHSNDLRKNVYVTDSGSYLRLKHDMKRFGEYVSEGLEKVDSTVIGDLRRIARIPGVTRPDTRQACLMIPPQWIAELGISEMLSKLGGNWKKLAVKSSEYYERYLGGGNPVGVDFADLVEVVPDSFVVASVASENKSGGSDIEYHQTDKLSSKMQTILRKAVGNDLLFQNLMSPNPTHDTRWRVVYKLFGCGLKPKQVKRIFAQLSPIDYNPTITSYQVDDLWARHQKRKFARSFNSYN